MIVVADPSVLINLVLVSQADLLRVLFREVLIAPAVQSEFHRLAESGGRFAGLRVPDWVQVSGPVSIPELIIRRVNLDKGETEALALALAIHADAVLIDESRGRAAAVEFGLTPIGVLGILVRAKRHGHLAAVAPGVDEFLGRANFRAAPELVSEVLRLAGEA